MALLVAGSPVEILVEADRLGFDDAAKQEASALFHELTSKLELDLLTTPADGGEPWPRHRFWFGAVHEIDALAKRLAAMPEAAEAPSMAAIVFEVRQGERWGAVLAAGAGPGWADQFG